MYQRVFSLDTGILRNTLFPIIGIGSTRICRHAPTCSEYTYQQISKYGIILGLGRGIKRISSCHPFSK